MSWESEAVTDREGRRKEWGAGPLPFTTALLACVTPEDVAAVVLEWGIERLGAVAGLVALVTRDGDELEIVGTVGYTPAVVEKWERMPLQAHLPLPDVVRGGVPLFFEDRDARRRRYPNLAGPIAELFDLAVSLPLLARQQAFGAVHFSFAEPRAFSEADSQILQELSHQGALALERALLLEQVQEERNRAQRAQLAAEAAQAQLAILAHAGDVLAESVAYRVRLESLARLTVPDLADWVEIEILDGDGTLERLAVAHRDPEREPVMREMQRRYPPQSYAVHPALTAIARSETLHAADIPDEALERTAVDSDHAALLRKIGVREALTVPLITRGRTLGAITLGMTSESVAVGRRFTMEGIRLVEELARRAAIAVDNARLFEKIRESEERFRVMADHAPTLIWMTDADGVGIYLNEPWRAFTGRTPELDAGDGWMESIHPDDLRRLSEVCVPIYNVRGPITQEYRLRRYDGVYRWILDNGVPRFGLDGTFLGYIGSCIDITDRRLAEQEREVALEENARLLRAAAETAEQQRTFLKDVLASVTEGRLTLCDSAAALPPPLTPTPATDPIELSGPACLRPLRRAVSIAAADCGLSPERSDDLLTAVSEAAMNALVHAGGGQGRVYADPAACRLQVWITDQGKGIEFARLPEAMLRKGYSSAGTLGHGFKMIHAFADRVYLLTGPDGTTVVIEQGRTALTPSWAER